MNGATGAARIAELFSLAGQTAIVTGGASGIGKGIAELFLHAGATVAIADLDLGRAREIAAHLTKAVVPGATAFGLHVDVADEPSVTRMFGEAIPRLGRLDILVNNAGIYFSRPFVDLSVEEWDRIHAVNVRGTFLCMREAVKHMKECGGGSIINLSSTNALNAAAFDNLHYGSTKAAVNNMTRSAALEFAEFGIRVNSLMPGGTNTEGGQRLRASGVLKIRGPMAHPERLPLKRRGEPLDQACAALYLCSPAGSWVTGVTLSVDGGYHVS